jgi:DNA polymerase
MSFDFETRSRVDLLKAGAYAYAVDESTEVLCLGYQRHDWNEPRLWLPGERWPAEIREVLDRREPASLWAHNAAFERLVFYYVLDFPVADPMYWYCTAAQAAARGLPRGLDNLARCIGHAEYQKDRRGKELIKLLCVPQSDGTWLEDDGLSLELFDYCLQDVRVERACASESPPLTEQELREYWANEVINDRGLKVDVNWCRKAVTYAATETAEVAEAFTDLTGLEMKKKPGESHRDWVRDRLSPDALALIKRYRKGEARYSLDSFSRRNLLLQEEESPGFIDQDVVEALELMNDIAGSSTSKYQRMLDMEIDGRCRGAYLFCGAGSTGRFSSRGIQMHNLKRAVHPNPEKIIAEGPDLDDSVMNQLASMLRPTIIAGRGRTLVWGDWSGIEARMLPWLADDRRAGNVLSVFRECDADPSLPGLYERVAEEIGESRQIGKVAVLSLGYGGGAGAFKSMAVNYGINVDAERADTIKEAWRAANPWAQRFWYRLRDAAWGAVQHPGVPFEAGRVTYQYFPGFLRGTLCCALPSGRVLYYPDARIEEIEQTDATGAVVGMTTELTAAKGAWSPKSGEKEWPRAKMWPGLLAENVTQAACACLLREALVTLEDADAPVVGHTHDEVLLEVPSVDWRAWANTLKVAMETASAWAKGLPLNAEIGHGKRYGK